MGPVLKGEAGRLRLRSLRGGACIEGRSRKAKTEVT